MPSFSRPAVVGFVFALAGAAYAIRVLGERNSVDRDRGQQTLFVKKDGGDSKKDKVAVDGQFARRMWRIIKIMVPGVMSVEAAHAATAAALLVARTYCDLWMVRTTTHIEGMIINRDVAGFKAALWKFALASVPIALVNNLLKYSLEEMTMHFRERLTRHLYKQYMLGYTYYKINNVDCRISNPDQLLTNDCKQFCQSVTDLFQNTLKPLLDMTVFASKLSATIGAQAPGGMMLYLVISGVYLTWLRRPVGRFTVNEQRLEGEFRFVNSRLIQNSEEIAFYQGARKEAGVIDSVFKRLMDFKRRSQQFRYGVGIIDSIVAKYFATIVGFWVVSRPFLALADASIGADSSGLRGGSHSTLMEDYYTSGRMLLNMSSAVGRLVLAGREMSRLSGFTSRVTELLDVLEDLNSGFYERVMVSDAPSAAAGGMLGATPRTVAIEVEAGGSRSRMAQCRGEIVLCDGIIKFEKVPLCTPNGDVLVAAMDLEVRQKMNVLIAGPNGCGKSSLFRVLGELWPLCGGRLTKPSKDKLCYIPQRPYLALGTLRDQIIFPDSREDMASRGATDADIIELLRQVHLEGIAAREDGLDAVNDWKDVLSGGEKQRVGMARLFYHRPQFAILDECTSAVSVDVEGFMYERARELNITLFTVSHRKSLWRFHDYVLQFDGRGAYRFDPIKDAEVFGS